MPTQSFTIASLATSNELATLIDPTLVDGGAVAYARVLNRVGTSIQFQLAATIDGDAFPSGPAMNDAWLVYASAMILESAGVTALTLKGPNHPDNSFRDASEPYFWTPDNSADMVAFFAAALGSEVTVTITDSAAVVTVLELDDSDDTGLEVVAKALIEAAGSTTVYADSDRGGTQAAGDLDANSDLTIGPDGTLLSRIQVRNNGAGVRLNDNDNPNSLSLATFFGASSTESEWTLSIQTLAGVASTRQLGGTSGGFANFTFADADHQTILDDIVAGTRLIFKIAKAAAAATKEIEFAFEYPVATATVAVTRRLTDKESIEFDFSYPVQTATVAVTKEAASQQVEDIEIDTSYPALQVTLALTKRQVDKEQIAFSFGYLYRQLLFR